MRWAACLGANAAVAGIMAHMIAENGWPLGLTMGVACGLAFTLGAVAV